MGAVPAACVKKGHQVDLLDGSPLKDVIGVHPSTPEPGRITWDIKDDGTVEIGGATMVLILNPTPIKEPRSR